MERQAPDRSSLTVSKSREGADRTKADLDEQALRDFARAEGLDPDELAELGDFDDFAAELSDDGEPEQLSIVTDFLAAKYSPDGQVPPARVGHDGHFELLEKVGEGSYGMVFRAEDRKLARKVAVKIMPIGDPDVADREGRLLAALEHPNVVRIYDHGRKDDYRWLVLEWLDGPTLFEWSPGKSPRQLLARYLEAGEGLHAAHRRGLVHRDFKANNVMLNADGRAVVVDFGLARNLESLSDDKADDPRGGALPYLAPERLRGQAGDERSDQFAFCVALWEALSGENPFSMNVGNHEERLEAVGQPPGGRQRIPRRLRGPLERGLASSPRERWPSMARLLDALRESEKPTAWRWVGLITITASLATIFTASLAAIFVGNRYVTRPSLPAFEITTVDEMSLIALRDAKKGDAEGAVQALRVAYAAVSREEKQDQLIDVATVVATQLQTQGHASEATDAWWMVTRLCMEVGDADRADTAAGHVDKLSKLL